MKKLQIAVLGAIVALAMFGGVALAAGPSAGTGPWEVASEDPCFTNSGAQGHLLVNTNSTKEHCFKD